MLLVIVSHFLPALANGYLQRRHVPFVWATETEQITTSNLSSQICVLSLSSPLITTLVKDLMVFNKTLILKRHELKHDSV